MFQVLYVTAKTWHIPLLMKIEIRLENDILVFNCVAVKNGSDRSLGSRVTEQNALRTQNATFHIVFTLLQ